MSCCLKERIEGEAALLAGGIIVIAVITRMGVEEVRASVVVSHFDS
jgi:hypothetical protein